MFPRITIVNTSHIETWCNLSLVHHYYCQTNPYIFWLKCTTTRILNDCLVIYFSILRNTRKTHFWIYRFSHKHSLLFSFFSPFFLGGGGGHCIPIPSFIHTFSPFWTYCRHTHNIPVPSPSPSLSLSLSLSLFLSLSLSHAHTHPHTHTQWHTHTHTHTHTHIFCLTPHCLQKLFTMPLYM